MIEEYRAYRQMGDLYSETLLCVIYTDPAFQGNSILSNTHIRVVTQIAPHIAHGMHVL